MSNPICPYCENESKLVGGDAIYPHRSDLFKLKFYLCKPCDAYVGTHKGSKKHAALGRLANSELRALKSKAHKAFDPLWKSQSMSRNEAYAWLAGELGIEGKDCHIGMFDEVTCRKVVATVLERNQGKTGSLMQSPVNRSRLLKAVDRVRQRRAS